MSRRAKRNRDAAADAAGDLSRRHRVQANAVAVGKVLLCRELDDGAGACMTRWIEPDVCRGALLDTTTTMIERMRTRQSTYDTNLNPNYLTGHPCLRPKMRSIVVDWMQQVCQEYGLSRETCHLATNYFDRYVCGQLATPPTRLQLVAVTALFIASKLEDVNVPTVADFAYTCAGSYAAAEILRTELDMVKALGWMLRPHSPSTWARLFLLRGIDQATPGSKPGRDLLRSDRFVRVMEVIDAARLYVKSLQYSPYVLAASVLFHMFDGYADLIGLATGMDRAQCADCMEWIALLDDCIPRVGLHSILDRGYRPPDMHVRQVYNPHALQVCLDDTRHN
ncbi:Cyclin-like domain-containing protein [Plasmodiophora brassicae]